MSFLIWALVLLQAGTASVVQKTASTASIEGVVRDTAGKPIGGARVTLSIPGLPEIFYPPAQTTTDGEGGFRLSDIAPGSYRLAAMRNGYVRREYGQRRASAPGTPIVLAAGEIKKELAIELPLTGSVSGHVRGADGKPLPGVPVELFLRRYDDEGWSSLESAGRGESNDLGEYRIYWVTPGRYYVWAGKVVTRLEGIFGGPVEQDFSTAAASGDNRVDVRYDPTFFPGTLDIEKAESLAVAAGREVNAVDFSLESPRRYRIHGRVVDSSTGQSPGALSSVIRAKDIPGQSTTFESPIYDARSGTYALNLGPGRYAIELGITVGQDNMISLSLDGTTAKAEIELELGGSETDIVYDILLKPPSPQVPVTGRIVVEPSPDKGVKLEGLGVLVNSVRATATADGSFKGEFAAADSCVSMGKLPEGLYLKSARFNDANVLGRSFMIAPGELNVTLGANGGKIVGVVKDRRGLVVPQATVVLIPVEQRACQEVFKRSLTDQDGRFTLAGIEPRAYQLFAWDAIEQYNYRSPDVLGRLEAYGKPVGVRESSADTVELEVVPAEDVGAPEDRR